MHIERIEPKQIMEEFKRILNDKGLLFGLIDEKSLEKALIMLFNRMNLATKFNSNITLSAESQELSNQYGEVFLKIFEKKFPSKNCRLMNEDTFYDYNNWTFRDKQSQVVIIQDCFGSDLEKLYFTLSEIEKHEWEPTVILCITHDTLDRIKAHADQDYRLYHYLCGLKVNLSEINIDNISNLIIEKLRQKKYETTDEFKLKLEQYVKAVYPEARLTKEAFIHDLIFRIYQTRYQKIVNDMKLDATDVPYSTKAENYIPGNSSNPSSQEMDKSEKNNKNPISANQNNTTVDYKIVSVKPVETHFSELKESKNVLLLSMSTLPPNKRKSDYCVIEDNEDEITYRTYTGVSQLEAGTKFFISKLGDHDLKPDKIIVLTTNEAKKPEEKGNNKSAVDVYCENITKYVLQGEEENNDLDNFLTKSIKEGNKKKKVTKLSNEYLKLYDQQDKLEKQSEDIEPLGILNHYLSVETIDLDKDALQKIVETLNMLAKDKHINLFIDLQGGSRTFMFTMFAATTLLRDRNVTIKEMFSINFIRSFNVHPIEIVTSEYAIIDLVAGIRAFSRYGKVEELKKFIESRESTRNDNEHEKRLLEIMEEIDGCMQINDPEGFSVALADLSMDNAVLLNKDYYNDTQFQLIAEDLADVYRPIIESSSVLNQIKWLEEKSFISSALTFIEDKIPEIIINNENITVSGFENMDSREIKKFFGKSASKKIENNIFNYVSQKLLNSVEEEFLWELCNLWAEKLKNSNLNLEEEIIASTLHTALFEITNRNELEKVDLLKFKKNIDQILKSIKLDKISIDVKKEKLKIFIDGKYSSLFSFAYKLWKRLIEMTSKINEAKIDEIIDQYIKRKTDIKGFLVVLDNLGEQIKDMEETDVQVLVDFAQAYIDCRKAIDIKNEEKPEYGNNSYRNIELHTKIEEYQNVVQRYFCKENGYYPCGTIAGMLNGSYVFYDDNGIENMKVELTVNRKRLLLDVLIRFYQALKKERNVTNHADGSSRNHMEYAHTKKAIAVFVELFKRLERKNSHEIEKGLV